MADPDSRDSYRRILADVKEKLACLPNGSFVKAAMPDRVMSTISERIEHMEPADLTFADWQPMFLFVGDHEVADLAALDADLRLIFDCSGKHRGQFAAFLNANQDRGQQWFGGLFETFIKSTLRRRLGASVQLDYVLPNGKDVDLRVELNRRPIYMECTALTDSDEDRGVIDRFLADKRRNPNACLRRPGKYDPPGSKGPTIEYDRARVLAKLYDKLSCRLDPSKGQLAEANPNIIALSLDTPYSPLRPDYEGVRWALDDLFAYKDCNLHDWLDRRAKDLISNCRLDLQAYCDAYPAILGQRYKVGAVLLFDRCLLRESRLNYNAEEACRLTHAEIARFERWLGSPPSWCKGSGYE